MNSISILNVNTDTFGNLKAASEPRRGSSSTIITHNFSDSRTWWEKSVLVSNEVAGDSGNHQTYTLAHQNVIDLKNGRLTYENDVPSVYKLSVSVNDFSKFENFDYIADHKAGTLTFTSPLLETDVVKVSYAYATTSIFTIKPPAGKILTMLAAEIQFSTNVQANMPALHFTTYMYYAPYGVVIPVKDTVYKNMKDIINESNNGSWIIQAPIGELTQNVRVFPFTYPASKDLYSHLQMRVECWVEGHQEIKNTVGGPLELSTGTFYCLIE